MPTFNPELRLRPKGVQIQVWDACRPKPMLVTVEEARIWTTALYGHGFATLDPSRRAALQQHGLLVDADACAHGVDLPATDHTLLPVDMRLTRHACLRAGKSCWVAWSPTLSDHVALPRDVAEALLAMLDGSSVAQWQTALCGDAARVAQLLDLGLLRRSTEPPAASHAGTGQTAVHLGGDIDPYSDCPRDGRTPIYFVTHHVDHLPLALGMLRAGIIGYRDGALLHHYLPLPIVSRDIAGMQALFRRYGPGIWLFSNYMWSYEYNRGLSAAVKSADPRNITIHGGPSAPKYEQACRDFMRSQPHVDIVARGEGEETLCEVLEALAGESGWQALDQVPGITYFRDRARSELVRTPERARISDVDLLASPYLSGHFDHYGGQVIAAILETNRGCPFACTFCDWGSATAAKIRRFDLQRVKDEIEWIGRRGIRVLWIADANFGIFPRDIEIAEHIATTKAKYGAPREVVVNYPKNATDKIADIVRIFAAAGICGQGIISIQTTDPTTLAVIRRDNIKTKKYDELGEIFRRENLPLSTDLMVGLPGATVASFKADLQYYFDDDVGVKAYRTQLLPNSPMADPDYLAEHRIRVDDSNYLVSTRSYSEADLSEMMAIWSAFDLADGYSVLRYVLRYLQWDHGLAATEVLHAWVGATREAPGRYPLSTWMLRHFLQERRVLEGWRPFYREFASFVGDRFGVGDSPCWRCVLELNELMMPEPGRSFPEMQTLPFDVAAYFGDHLRARGQSNRPLRDYGPGMLEVNDPFRMCELDYSAIEQYDNHQVFFELATSISRRRSAPNFVDAQVA